jgi:hypothetical protein
MDCYSHLRLAVAVSRHRGRPHRRVSAAVWRDPYAQLATAWNNSDDQLARELAPWVLCSLIIILVSGFMLFASEALKAYASVPFQVKMLFLFAAIAFHYTVIKQVTKADEARIRPLWNKVVAVISLALWLGVGIGGRGIGFL